MTLPIHNHPRFSHVQINASDLVLRHGALQLYPLTGEVKIRNRLIYLTASEYRLLILFMTHQDRVIAAETIAKILYKGRRNGELNAVYPMISRLRAKIEPGADDPFHIQTIPNEGYIMRRIQDIQVAFIGGWSDEEISGFFERIGGENA